MTSANIREKLAFYHFDHTHPKAEIPADEAVDFLFTHLEQYGDPRHHIAACLDYAISAESGKGGFLLICRKANVPAGQVKNIVGAVIVNKTGMSGFIPENILVYIAVDGSQRGMGIGKSLMTMALEHAEGAVALHVEPDNPARKLYEKLGFTNKYLEMRYQPADGQ